ncbi:MAG TPA: radical SAM protein, partial [Luteimonas sp.]|nr:radical SAM protein [Luteimonas sp.]
MPNAPRTLLVNPTIASRRSARFPLALLTLSAALERNGAGSSRIIDGNVDREFVDAALRAIEEEPFDLAGISVMGGPQLAPAMAVSRAIRERFPKLPIAWGGYFPTLNTEAAIGSPDVDYVIRGPGDETLPELVAALRDGDHAAPGRVAGLSWKNGDAIVHNPARRIPVPAGGDRLPYELLGDPRRYLARTYLGRRTAVHQAATGCRFRCTFCGVAAMYGGATYLSTPERLDRDLTYFKHELGADSVQYLDNNFFDREQDMIPLLEVMARHAMPWWCYARADALLGLSARGWELVRKSRLRMAYIGAESPSGQMLKDIRKGTRPDQTVEAVKLCRRQGVIPELSFMVAPPENTEEETERTFDFIRELKRINPDAEVIVYIYTPLPDESRHESDRRRRAPVDMRDLEGRPVVFPKTVEEWAE